MGAVDKRTDRRVVDIPRVVARNEPRFDLDLAYGRQAELQIDEMLTWIAKGNGCVEVKRKRLCDLEFYIEQSCDRGGRGVYHPSGIMTTTAHMWAFVIDDSGIAVCVPTALIRAMLDDPTSQPAECRRGNCPTRGVLINFGTLLYRYKTKRIALGAL